MMSINHGIENHVVFVACITMWFSSAGREWKQEIGQDVKGLIHIREGRRLSRYGGVRIIATIAKNMDIKEPLVGSSIQRSV